MDLFRRIPWFLSLVIAFVVLVPASSLAQASGTGSGDILEGTAAGGPQQVIPPEDGEALVPPDEPPPPPNSPIVRLTGALQRLDRYLGLPLDPAIITSIQAARRHTQSAHDAWTDPASVNLPANLQETVASIQMAVVALEEAPVGQRSLVAAVLEANSRDLAGIARKISIDLLLRARAGGVAGPDLFRALLQILAGDQLIALGDFGGGVGQYGNSLAVGNHLKFDLDQFQINIILTFENETVGYSYAIAVGGQLERLGSGGIGPNGLARTAADPPETPQSPTKEMNIASVSKPITAVAILRLMEASGVDPDDPILPYLPPSWNPGPCIAPEDCGDDPGLTFRDLMTHRSGLNGNAGGSYDYASLRSYIEAGINPADKTFKYQNANFGVVARVLLPMLLCCDPEAAPDPAFSASAIYRLYVAGVLFQPIGVTGRDCLPNDPNQTLLYPFPYDNSNGYAEGDWTLVCGSGGWFMSAVELLNFFAHVRFDDSMLSPLARQWMDSGFLGWQSPLDYNFASGVFGTYRGHGGRLNRPPDPRGMDACVMNFPEDVQVSLLLNSKGGAYPSKCAALKQAYENAWVAN